MSDCDRLELRAGTCLANPLVPLATKLCASTRPGNAMRARERITASRLTEGDLDQLLSAMHMLVRTIPGLIVEGRSEDALERLELVARSAALLDELPRVWLHRRWCDCVSELLLGCRYMLACAPPGLNWQLVRQRLEELKPLARLERSLVDERAYGIDAFEEYRSGSTARDDRLRDVDLGWIGRRLFANQDFAFYLDQMHWEIERARLPLPQRDKKLEPWDQWTKKFPAWAAMSRRLTPSGPWTYRPAIELEAELRLALTGIEANQSGLDAGLLRAANTQDPLGNGPLGARVEDGALLIWSRGFNHIDDGGRTGSDGWSCPNDPMDPGPRDIVWTVRPL
jgi:hypothetical protein